MSAINALAFLLQLQGRLEEAEPYYLLALEQSRALDEDDLVLSYEQAGARRARNTLRWERVNGHPG